MLVTVVSDNRRQLVNSPKYYYPRKTKLKRASEFLGHENISLYIRYNNYYSLKLQHDRPVARAVPEFAVQ